MGTKNKRFTKTVEFSSDSDRQTFADRSIAAKDLHGFTYQGDYILYLMSLEERFADQLPKASKPQTQASKPQTQPDELLSEKEQAIVREALTISGLTLQQLQNKGVVAEGKRIVSSAKALENVDISKLKESKVAGAAQMRIEATVKEVMVWNVESLQSKNLADHLKAFYISESFIAKLCGSNRPAVKQYFSINKDEIDGHNEQYNLTPEFNLKPNLPEAKKELQTRIDTLLGR